MNEIAERREPTQLPPAAEKRKGSQWSLFANLVDLVRSDHHSIDFSGSRADYIHNRVRILGLLYAAVVVLWIPRGCGPTEKESDLPEIQSSKLVEACRLSNRGRPPLWIMRQAGRYMPEYRAIRRKVRARSERHKISPGLPALLLPLNAMPRRESDARSSPR